jgi:Dolichyl-phosphate-mannose-protein mannosyltransferase
LSGSLKETGEGDILKKVSEELRAGLYGKHPLPVLFVFAATLLLWSWHQWADVLMDSGFNTYTIWQVSVGKVLYRDISYTHGPLSPHFNALLFRIFGVSMEVLAIANATAVALIAWFIQKIFTRIFDLQTAWAAAILFLSVFAFGQYSSAGNYNFILPYKPEATHGSLLGFLMLWAFSSFLNRKKLRYIFVAGLATGTSILTSFDITVACCLGSLIAMAMILIAPQEERQEPRLLLSAMFLAGILLPLFCSVLLLSRNFPVSEALAITFKSLLYPLSHPELSQLPFYRSTSGVDDIPGNSKALLSASLIVFGSLGVLSFLERRLRDWHPLALKTLCALFPAAFGLYAATPLMPDISGIFFRAVPLGCVVAILLSFYLYFFSARLPLEVRQRWLMSGIFASYALILLGKKILTPMVEHYGFYLCLPGMLCLLATFASLIPELLGQRFLAKSAAFGACVYLAIHYFLISDAIYNAKEFLLGRGGDAIATYKAELTDQGRLEHQALLWIEKNVPPTAKLLTLPEGQILNYLSRRESLGPHTMHPLDVLEYGEAEILRPWKQNPPEFIMLITRTADEFGFSNFGLNPRYGQMTMDWIKANYDLKRELGNYPFEPGKFGIFFYQLRDRQKPISREK